MKLFRQFSFRDLMVSVSRDRTSGLNSCYCIALNKGVCSAPTKFSIQTFSFPQIQTKLSSPANPHTQDQKDQTGLSLF
jgi:hypothetical protein